MPLPALALALLRELQLTGENSQTGWRLRYFSAVPQMLGNPAPPPRAAGIDGDSEASLALRGCDFFNLSVRPRMAGRGAVTQVTDSRERVRACTGPAIEENHREWFCSQALSEAWQFLFARMLLCDDVSRTTSNSRTLGVFRITRRGRAVLATGLDMPDGD